MFIWEFFFGTPHYTLLSRSVITQQHLAVNIVFLLFISSYNTNTNIRKHIYFCCVDVFFLPFVGNVAVVIVGEPNNCTTERIQSVCPVHLFHQFLYQFVFYCLCICSIAYCRMYSVQYFAFQCNYGLFIHIHYNTQYTPIVTHLFFYSFNTITSKPKTDSCTCYHICMLYYCVVRWQRECILEHDDRVVKTCSLFVMIFLDAMRY